MDTKKLILAIVLSVTVLLVYQYFFMPKPVAQHQAPLPAAAQQQKTEVDMEAKGGAAPDIGSILNQPETAAPESELPVQTVSENLTADSEQKSHRGQCLFYRRVHQPRRRPYFLGFEKIQG